MKTYLLFVFGAFEDHQDIEYFCMEILASSPMVKSVRYVIENSKNIIVIFDSDKEHKDLSTELYSLMINDSVKFYFLKMGIDSLTPEEKKFLDNFEI